MLLRLPLLFLLSLTSLETSANVQIGTIRNAWWNQSTTNVWNWTASCNECICAMVMSFSNVIGLNCLVTSRMCYLFANYSTGSSTMISNANSTFYFRTLPPTSTPTPLTIPETETLTTTQVMPSTGIFWPFDNNTRDFYGVYNGVAVNGASYLSPGITGYGSSISFQPNLSQYVNIPSPALNLVNSSFTFEIWLNARSLSTLTYDGLIGQCISPAPDVCLHLSLTNGQAYLGFFADDCRGKTVLNISTWYHLAFVYSYELHQQSIYLDGIIDCQNFPAYSYHGSSEVPITIGMIIPAYQWFFNGQIDQVTFINRAKNDNEILDDATLVIHYSFDSDLLDSGPMGINGTGVNVSFVNQAVEFAKSPSNVQATGLVLLGTSNRSYSIALWIYPYLTTGGSLVYLWTTATLSAWCLPLLGLSTSGAVIVQQYNGTSVISISSRSIPNATWTHIANTYSMSTGIQLYINGTLVNSSIPFAYSAMSIPGSIMLGQKGSAVQQTGCDWQPSSIVTSQYYGLIDEFYLYSRQLNLTEVKTLAVR